MSKSNITIASNIFVRTSPYAKEDLIFVEKVRGRAALNVLKEQLFGLASRARLTDAQEQERKEGSSCGTHLNKKQEKTFGPILVDGQVHWACRCENPDCPHFHECMALPYAKRISRPLRGSMDQIIHADPSPLTFTRLGIDAGTIFTTIETSSEVVQEAPEEVIPEEVVIQDQGFFDTSHSFTEISDPTIIIESSIDTHILVNAGPGTGKTYSAIRRLEYVLANRLTTDPTSVLLLCYTNAAKREIEDRIKSAVSKGELPVEVTGLTVYTFDSLASFYLLDAGESMDGLDYDQRIELFNRKITPEPFEQFEYLIIDELQDLVNQRAAMTLSILQNIRCGYLLLGDKCQAIYDYDCKEDEEQTINSVAFYKRLDELLPLDTARYELIGNRRQSPGLMKITEDMRAAILNFKPIETNELIRDEILKLIPAPQCAEELTPERLPGKKIAILCRNNGEAEWLSASFRKRGIPHTLLRGSGQKPSLSRWLGDVFWDLCEPRIDQQAFVKRYTARVCNDEEQAQAAYDALVRVCGYEGKATYLLMDDVVKGLESGIHLPPQMLNETADDLTVSTIHKAKGREYDQVYLLYSSMDVTRQDTEEARVWYVGATRSRSGLERLNKQSPYRWYFRRNPQGRCFRTQWAFGTFCSDMAIGLPGDVDDIGSVDSALGDSINLQAYIAEQVKVNDPIECVRGQGDVYFILHKGTQIGKLYPDIGADFRSAINMTNNRRNIPPRLYDHLYVSNIVTVVQRQFSERIPLRFRESRLWLGIEIAGFARIDWHYGEGV